VEGKVEEVKNQKNEVEERARIELKEKDEAKSMVQKTQAVLHKLYKEVSEVSIVVEDTILEQVLNIGEVIKGL
jgi:hypothetical protein